MGFLSQKKAKPGPPPLSAKEKGFPDVNNRLRILEDRTRVLNQKTEIIENNILDFTTSSREETSSINNDMLEIKRSIDQIKQEIRLIIKELKMLAGKEDLEGIKKYLDLWNPVKFATYKEVEEMINEKLGDKNAK